MSGPFLPSCHHQDHRGKWDCQEPAVKTIGSEMGTIPGYVQLTWFACERHFDALCRTASKELGREPTIKEGTTV